LELLGVSRDYELEADQLGVQYAWNAGYDPSGFIRFFDKIAMRDGYVNGASWFQTHPPFLLPEDGRHPARDHVPARPAGDDGSDFCLRTDEEGVGSNRREREKEELNKSSLKITRQEGCQPPKKLEYKPGQPIEEQCSAPPQTVSGIAQ
jgi:predicted Zn-dependent protease